MLGAVIAAITILRVVAVILRGLPPIRPRACATGLPKETLLLALRLISTSLKAQF
jgi:hypothetical protein